MWDHFVIDSGIDYNLLQEFSNKRSKVEDIVEGVPAATNHFFSGANSIFMKDAQVTEVIVLKYCPLMAQQ